MDWHIQSPEAVLKNLGSSKGGLKESEVQKRFGKYGKNILRKYKTKSKFQLFLGQFNSLLVWILIIAAIISIIIGHLLDAGVILVVVFLNATVGFIQEYKAEEIIEKLRRSLRYKVLVLRDGIQKEIDSKFLVPGDIVLLESGDNVLADCRILEQENLQANESVLSGESFPIDKNAKSLNKSVVLAERKNMLYAGTTIARGKSTAIVVATGQQTEFGKLAELVQTTKDEQMPLEKKLDEFSTNVSIAILIFVTMAFFMGIGIGISKFEMFLVSVSLAIAAIPSALPAIVAISLAIAIKQMHKVNTLIRKLPAAETLGRATVICTDKTGTLTEENLTIDKIYSGKLYSLDKVKTADFSLKQVLKIGILCNNARDEKDDILGDPTEISLIKAAKKFGFDKKDLTEKNPRVKEYPFDSIRKMMSIIRKEGEIKTSYVKGAPSFILERCTRELIGDKACLINSKRRDELRAIAREMENAGLRVLGLAFRQVTNISQKDAENNLIFTGFSGMIDPPRKEVAEAIREALVAGIKIKIITGDSALTTKNVAKKIGLDGDVVTGRELDVLSDEAWNNIVREKTIFARVTPQQKLKIVEILKKQNETVAVTGDGVNDILALKRADIGVAMGIRGSDVARDSSDMVLLDDNFASIIKATRQGRCVFDNMKKSIKFLLAANAGEVFVVLLGLILGWPLIFLPLAILWMNLATDSLPSLALAAERPERDVMKRKPRSDGLLSGVWGWILVAGFLMTISVMLIFSWANANINIEVARTMAITTAIFFELFFAFSCKSGNSLLSTGILDNKWLIYSVLISIGLHLLVIYTAIGGFFGFVSLSGFQLGISALAGLSGLIVFETWKVFRSFYSSRR